MRAAIYGAGSLGTILGAYITKNGGSIELINRNKAHIEALQKEGAKVIRMADMANIIDADIYIHSHTHLPVIMKEAYYRTDQHNSTFQIVDKLFVNTSSMLNYGGDSEAVGYKPCSKDCPIIYINGTKKEFTAKL